MSPRHVRPVDLEAWVLGEADGLVSLSVEQHVVACPRCQAAVADLVGRVPAPTAYAVSPGDGAADVSQGAALPDLDTIWDSVRDEIELPRASLLERVLVRLGLPPGEAMVVAAAPALRGSWLCAVALAVAFAVGGAMAARTGNATVFLTVAPIVPVLGVATAFGPEVGAALEQESAAPYPLVRLVLLRTGAVLLTALPVVLVGQLLFPEAAAWVWLLPALGFTAAVLALSTWFGPWWPTTTITALWVVGTAAANRLDTIWAVFDPRCVVLYLVMLLVGPPVLVLRARRLGTIGRIAS
ncbi:hypothetical protein GCM10009721_11960 [Terrabacter tumescens]|uniref:Zinc-finger domain-containing protein n=1 Tax=Terrabacter tumescens TaxID=60443 RepID=A0ABQ2HQD7_9MICO|nr:hypothetical protein [Terrabacter tumescens]GGM88494.1 hypothetical protein GCM10009721_11960 [Terrabacter tumescens]